MKRKLSLLLFLPFIAILYWISYSIYSEFSYQKKQQAVLEGFSDFRLKTLDNKLFTNKDLPHNTPIMFIYFNSNCDFCLKEIKFVIEEQHTLRNWMVYLISSEEPKKISSFIDSYPSLKSNNFIVLQDFELSFWNMYMLRTIPSTILFDLNRKLLAYSTGLEDMENIKFLIRENSHASGQD